MRGVSVAAAPGTTGAVLHGLDLTIAAGEQVAVIGASGAGKTTLLLALAAALPPLAGELRVLGQSPWSLRPAARRQLRARLFLAPQVPPLPPRQRVVSAVLAARLPQIGLLRSLRMLLAPRLDADEAGRALAALAALHLPDKLWHRVDRLSGGERQRVGLARALVSDAALWLVDEPLSALDPTRAIEAIAALQQAARERGRTLVCSLHQVAVARERFGRVLALRDGRLVYDGPGSGLDDARLQALYGDALSAPLASPPESELQPSAGLPNTMCR
ncbi:MAG: ATP-binding cassette domain-containing protein [Burkholderiales bacterium]